MKLKSEAIRGIIEICQSHKDEPSPLMVILEEIQRKFGYVPIEVQEIVSEQTGVPVAEIYGVVTFYNFLSLEPKGKYVVGVCLGTACYVKNSQNVIDKFCSLLNVKPGQTTEDGLFTIEALRCLGACALAPAVSINGKVYAGVKVDQVQKIINEYKKLEAQA